MFQSISLLCCSPENDLSALGIPLHGTFLLLLLFTVKELPLLVGIHTAESPLPLFLLQLLSHQLALFSLLLLILAAQLLDLLLTDVPDLAHNLGPEVAKVHKSVGQP